MPPGAVTATTHLAAARVTLGLYANAASVCYQGSRLSPRGFALIAATWAAARILQAHEQTGAGPDPDTLCDMYAALAALED